jgi:hypothetical protein
MGITTSLFVCWGEIRLTLNGVADIFDRLADFAPNLAGPFLSLAAEIVSLALVL